jgi:hypothetical protein
MPDVVLLYDRDCPNVRTARTNLMKAFGAVGTPAAWREVALDDTDTPREWAALGSPTILVDGRDVAGGEPGVGRSCRVYTTAEGLAGAPSVDVVANALRAPRVEPVARSPRMSTLLPSLPGIAFAMLPKLACPACWPAYAGLLSSLGVGFLVEVRYLLPLTALFVAEAVAALAWRAPRRRGYGPAVLGLGAGVVLLLGKFWLEIETFTWVGVGMLVVASLWNSWPKPRPTGTCPACVGDAA